MALDYLAPTSPQRIAVPLGQLLIGGHSREVTDGATMTTAGHRRRCESAGEFHQQKRVGADLG